MKIGILGAGEIAHEMAKTVAGMEDCEVLAVGARELLRAEGRSLYGQANLAVCTARLTEELVQVLLELRGRGRFPLLFFVLPGALDEEARRAALRPRSLLEAAGIPCYVLPDAGALDRGWH